MILYVNGDSHAAGTDIHLEDFFDQHQTKINNLKKSFGYLLAEKLGYKFVSDAEAGASNDRIYRTTKQYLEKNSQNVFVLIGWSTTDRKEFLINNKYQSFAPGFRTNDPVLLKEFKKYMLSLDYDTLIKQNHKWHKKIYNFHKELEEKNIPHLFFNTYGVFNNDDDPSYDKIHYDWNQKMIGAYNEDETYYGWLKNKGHKTVRKDNYHYGSDAHQHWAERLNKWLTQHQMV